MERLFRNPRILFTAVTLIAVAGLAAVATIVRQEDPTITNGVALIITPFPGASAERVESLVTEKLENELQKLREIQTLSSVSRAGISVVTVQLDENLVGSAAVEPIFSRVRDAIADAKVLFPPGVRDPIFDDERFGAYTLIFGLRWTGDGEVPRDVLQRYASVLEDELRAVAGTDHAKVYGASTERVQVLLDPDRVAAARLTPQAVAAALRGADAKVAAGVLRTDAQNLFMEVSGELDALARVRSVPLVAHEQGILRVGDLARVERGLDDPPREQARIDGRHGVLVTAQLGAGERFDLWRARVEPRLERFRAELPDGLEVSTVFDQTVYTQARLQGLFENLATGLLLVIIVLFATLGVRSALVVTVALPLVSACAIAVLRFMGVPIHQMSVTGLIVALGLLVDNAIVVVDAIRTRRLEGMSGAEAVRVSIAHLRLPLFASTATTVLAFMPILILPGRVGEFVGTIALSVIVALIASYLIALTVIAALAGRFISGQENTSRWSAGLTWTRGARWFDRSLAWSLERPKLSMLMAGTLPLFGFVGATTVPKQFFPPADRDQFHIEMYLAPSAAMAATERAADRAEAVLRSYPEVREVHWSLGRSAPPFYYNMLQNQDGNPAFGQALVMVEDVADVQAIFPKLQADLDEAVPEAQLILRELLQGPPVRSPVAYRIYGPNVDVLRDLGEQLRLRMSRVPTITHSRASLTASSPKLAWTVDEDQALLAGLRGVEIAGQLQLTLEGLQGGSVLEGSEEVPVVVRAEPESRTSLANVASLPLLSRTTVAAAGFPAAPLSALASVDLVPVLDGIPRRGSERVNIVRGYTSAGVFPETAFQGLNAVLEADPIDVPSGYRLEVGGDAEKRADALGDLFASVPVLVILMVAAVALSLNSFRLGAVIFVVAFQSMGFGLLSLSLLRFPLGFQGIIGTIGLVGIAINAGIVIFSALQANPAAAAGDPKEIRSTVMVETSRHIISTTITTFGGFLPLLLSQGGFWPPFAAVIAGGVVLSTIGSFYFVPQAFLVLTRQRSLANWSH